VSEDQRIVLDFIDACSANDIEAILDFFDPDCVYHNMPVAPVKGIEAIRGVLESFLRLASKVDWQVRSVADAGDGTVLTERLDRFLMGKTWVELPVMGAFEVRGGKITAWRDYFDFQQFQKQLPPPPDAG